METQLSKANQTPFPDISQLCLLGRTKYLNNRLLGRSDRVRVYEIEVMQFSADQMDCL